MAFEPIAVPAWDDLRFPAQGINPAGSAAPPGVDANTGMLEFSGTVDNIISGVAQMPHRWLEGSVLRPHIHLVFPASASANTRWKFEYNIGNVNGDFTNAMGTYDALPTITVANPQNVKKHVIASFGDLDMTGRTLSCVILWRVSRLANSDAADNYTGVVELAEFDIHYQANDHGTINEFGSGDPA